MSKTRCVVCNSDFKLDKIEQHSGIMLRKASLTWTISDFSQCNLSCGELLLSPLFGISGMDKKFHLSLYPQGWKEASKEYIAVFLRSDSDDEVTVNFTIAIVHNEDRSEDVTRYDHIKNNFKINRGWDKFILREELQRKSCHLLPKDELTLSCVVTTSSTIMCYFHSIVYDSGIWTMLSRRSLSVLKKGSLTWTLRDFSKCDLKKGEALVSSDFWIEEIKFHLKLFPRGLVSSPGECISVFLYSDSSDVICVNWIISVVNRNKDFSLFIYKPNFKENWGIDLISRKEILNNNSDLLPNDELTLTCVVNVTDHIANEELEKNPNVSASDNNDTLIQAWSTLKVNKFTDVVMKTGAATKSAPKFLLKACSAVFASMLKDLKTDSDAAVFDTILQEMASLTCYSDDIDFRLKLLQVAHRRDMSELRTECIEYLTEMVSKSNIIDIVIIADSLGDQVLYANCLDYISQNLLSKRFLSTCKKPLKSYPKIIQDISELLTK